MLGQFCDPRAIAVLINACQDSSERIRETAEVTAKKICDSVKIVSFGENQHIFPENNACFPNPDSSLLTLPLPSLKIILIHTDSYNFHLLERFMTYSVNYLGQKHLKKQVDVHVHGDPHKLHPNLWNNLENLCKSIHVDTECCQDTAELNVTK